MADRRDRELLRLATAGSVDDGKSTLIGRLLLDTKLLLSDQLAAVSQRDGAPDLAALTDGLRAEREQGITIDVAYRYFATPRRTFILADTPGHERYTRNMFTGASTADLTIVLVDARAGVVVQTRRHAQISALLRIRHVVVAINKMDLVDFSQERFDELEADARALGENLGLPDLHVVPMSALDGDNVADRSERMPWYDGPPLLEILETVDVSADRDLNQAHLRLPIQWVARPLDGGRRVYTGQLAAGTLRPGDEVVVIPSDIRHGLSDDLGFAPGDRAENARRVGQVARLFADAGVVAVVSLVSPLRSDREIPRQLHDAAELPFLEVHVDTSIEECARRDPKGLYARARAGEIKGFTGVDAPYESPDDPEIRIATAEIDVEAAVAEIIAALDAS